jgi:hypothetical protein
MLKNKTTKFLVFSLLLVVVLISASGCSAIPQLNPPTATPTEIPPTNTPMPSPTTVPPTVTPAPTNTAIPTATALPALAIAPDGIDPWCLRTKYFISHVDGPNGPASKPELATDGAIDKKTGVINFTIPAVSCTLVLTFNQPAPTGMKFQVWDARPQEPFITYDMVVNPSNPKEAYVVFNHTYLVNPPEWWMDYTAVVVTSDGKEVFRNPIHVQKPLPEKCWDGSYPNPITEACPIQDS